MLLVFFSRVVPTDTRSDKGWERVSMATVWFNGNLQKLAIQKLIGKRIEELLEERLQLGQTEHMLQVILLG